MKKAILFSMLLTVLCPAYDCRNETIPIPDKQLCAGKPKKAICKTIERVEVFEYLGDFELTAYCPCSSCSDGWGWQTSTGTECVEGRTIAVDPRKIPYGSIVRIKGIGEFVAEDCGGAINGNRIDVFIADHSRCLDFGRFKAEVYLKKE